jgi:hypothetical protein
MVIFHSYVKVYQRVIVTVLGMMGSGTAVDPGDIR